MDNEHTISRWKVSEDLFMDFLKSKVLAEQKVLFKVGKEVKAVSKVLELLKKTGSSHSCLILF
jgi:hypothetical protein